MVWCLVVVVVVDVDVVVGSEQRAASSESGRYQQDSARSRRAIRDQRG